MAKFNNTGLGKWRPFLRWGVFVLGVILVLCSFTTASFCGFVGKLVSIVCLFIGIYYRWWQKGRLKRSTYLNLMTMTFALAIALLVSETVLRSSLCNKLELRTYMEKNGDPTYESPFQTVLTKCDSCGGRYYLTYRPYADYATYGHEYFYRCKYNSMGFKGGEFPKDKGKDEYRILGLGDSFMEGMGAPDDSSLLKLMQSKLNSSPSSVKYKTINAGIAGSDLFFCYDMLATCLLQYQPDLVILNLNSSDINDVIMRGGNERYDAKGTYVGRKGPWWEYLFGSSYIARLVAFKLFHRNWQLMTDGQLKQEEEMAVEKISNKIADYQKLADEKHFKFLLVMQPILHELRNRSSPWDKLRIPANVKTVNLYEPFSKLNIDSVAQLYWPIDQHFNGRGYDFEAGAVCNKYFWPER